MNQSRLTLMESGSWSRDVVTHIPTRRNSPNFSRTRTQLYDYWPLLTFKGKATLVTGVGGVVDGFTKKVPGY